MRAWPKRTDLAAALGLLLLETLAWAAGFQVLAADTRLHNGVYLLNADIRYDFSKDVLEALHNSVPLTLLLQIEVRRGRSLLWDETVAARRLRFRLEYHALAEQYVITDLSNDTVKSFPSQQAAIAAIGRIRNIPLLAANRLNGGPYYGQLRVSLDIEALPAPLRPVAYLSSDWRLKSAWFRWPLT